MIKAYAAVKAGSELESYEYDPGELKPTEVEIDVEHCGICHSDISMIDNEWGISQYPLVAGHEVVGRIAQVGEQVRHLKVGDAVGLGWHSGYCMTCSTCMSGDHNLCGSSQLTIGGHHGGFAEKVRAEAPSVVKLPDGLDRKMAGPLFCGGITVFNPLVQFDIKPTDRIAVIGIGGLGHLAIQFASAWGCEVTAFTSSESKSDDAKKLGASNTINSRDPKAIAAAANSFDLIICTVNVRLDWNTYLSTLKPKGRLHFVGATLEPVDVGVFPMLLGQKSVSASPVGSPAVIAQMLDFVVQHNIQCEIEEFSFDQINAALDRSRSGQARYRVVLSR
jgi:uncharacterized zinc-type alcohol dehydrogenase-like protein